MSLVYCNYCGKNIDTDFDSEHFVNKEMTKCIIEESRDYFDSLDLEDELFPGTMDSLNEISITPQTDK